MSWPGFEVANLMCSWTAETEIGKASDCYLGGSGFETRSRLRMSSPRIFVVMFIFSIQFTS